jgi:hypothetical protein
MAEKINAAMTIAFGVSNRDDLALVSAQALAARGG